MNRFLSGAARLSVPVLLAIQIACGGDASGPKHSAATIEANSSPSIVAPAGTAALERPSVIVKDENGDPLRGATVVFSVTGGDGSLGGATVQTDVNGVATVGSWRLGATATVNTVNATVGGLPAVEFIANAGDPCFLLPTYSIGATTTGRLGLADCEFPDGSFVDFYSMTVPSTGTYMFTESSTAVDSFLWLLTTEYHLVAQNSDASTTTTNSTIKAILPAGVFLVGANSLDPRETGTYTITSEPTTSPVSNCEDVFVFPGITTDQSLQGTDCIASGLYSDDYIILLNPGQSITVTMTSTAIDPYLELWQISSGAVVAANDDIDATTKNATLTYKNAATTSAYFFVKARTTSSGTMGAYTLSIQ